VRDAEVPDPHRPDALRASPARPVGQFDPPVAPAGQLARDRNICYLCGEFANRVDHVVPGDNHDLSNLAAICLACDRHKSAVEGGRASRRYSP
jgi:5-methylcytosine-specific restriction endonuclease McrA